jgi:hypothetical protein
MLSTDILANSGRNVITAAHALMLLICLEHLELTGGPYSCLDADESDDNPPEADANADNLDCSVLPT